jgi:hypothetical protein
LSHCSRLRVTSRTTTKYFIARYHFAPSAAIEFGTLPRKIKQQIGDGLGIGSLVSASSQRNLP